MRIGVVSDIHGNLPALEAVVRDLKRRGVDQVVNLGDSLSGPLMPLETAQFLMAQSWIQLAGNHERQILTGEPGQRNLSDEYAFSQLSKRELDWLATLAPSFRYSGEVLLCHGTPHSDLEYLLETVEQRLFRLSTRAEINKRLGGEEAELILCGHSHLPRAVRTHENQLIVNPGSVGLPAYDDDRPYHHLVETGSPDARYAIVERKATGWTVSLISVAYPHHLAVQLALAQHRPDWACALASGYTS